MFLSRFWYLVLAVAAGAGVATAFLAHDRYNKARDAEVEGLLVRDQIIIGALLKLDARSRIDALAAVGADADVRRILSAASRRTEEAALRELNTQLTPRLTLLNGQLGGMRGDLVFATDARGKIVAQLGPHERSFGAGYGTFPLVERALSGFLRDDVWLFEGKLYRMAARPVIDNGVYVGAIVHGMEMNADLAGRLSEKLGGATVAFYTGPQMLATSAASTQSIPSPREVEIGGALPAILASPEMRNDGRTGIRALGDNGRILCSLVTGSAAELDAGWCIARARQQLASPWDLLRDAPRDSIVALPLPYLGGGVVLAFLFGMFFVWAERDRPWGRFRKAIDRLGRREVERLDITAFRGAYRRAAAGVNDAIDKTVERMGDAPAKRPVANLDDILGPVPGAQSSGGVTPFFQVPAAAPPGSPSGTPMGGFPSQSGGFAAPPPSSFASPSAPPAFSPPPGARASSSGPHAGLQETSLPPTPPMRPPSSLAATMPMRPGDAPPGMGGAPAVTLPGRGPAPPAPPPGGRSPTGPISMPSSLKSTVLGPAGTPPPPPAAAGSVMQGFPHVSVAQAAPLSDDGLDEGQTTVARVPEELLASMTGQNEALTVAAADEALHFRQVFEEFVAMRKTTGESTDGLTYDKFVVTLRKNRDAILSKVPAKSVRFQVHIKDGKAALKATPVKD